jgi:transmembrane sensor
MSPTPEVDIDAQVTAATEAAASWFARLQGDRVSAQDLLAFQTWRTDPCHDAAYRKVEETWRRGEALHHDPDIALALSAALNRPSRSVRFRGSARGLLVAAGLLMAVLLGGWAVSAGLFGGSTYQTAVGQERDVRLADGSEVRLDTDSRLQVRLAARGRYLHLLRGRAFFTVAHDASRPFLVFAGHAQVRAVGTRFSVEMNAADTRVVLVQGIVSVASTRPGERPVAVRMAAGQELMVDGAPSPPRPIDVSAATSWLQHQLAFHDLPLRDAVSEVNRYTDRKVILDVPEVGDTPVNGVFTTGDAQGFATAAAEVCGLKVAAGANGTRRLQALDPHS